MTRRLGSSPLSDPTTTRSSSLDPPSYQARAYQEALRAALTTDVLAGRRRVVEVMHRRGGKDLTAWNSFVWLAQHWRVGQYYYSFPTYGQAKRAIWQGITNEGRRFLDYVPRDIIATKAGRPAVNDSDLSIELTNGSRLQLIGGDNYNTIVGANPVAIAFSEWPLTDPAALDYFRPMVRANDGLLVFLYTPRGYNHGKTVWDTYSRLARERPERYFAELQTIEDTGALSVADVRADIDEGMSEELARQEYYCDFTVANQGTYYGRLMQKARDEGRIGGYPHDPGREVYVVADIGLSDHTALGFWQTRGGVPTAIDYYANHGHGADHYAQVLEDRRKERGYRYPRDAQGNIRVALPHDAGNAAVKDGETYVRYIRRFGVAAVLVPKTELEVGVEATRLFLARAYFHEPETKRLIEALESYQKQWNEALKVWGDKPLHNWASHPADMVRYAAQGLALLAQPAGLAVVRQPESPWYVR
jgi:phage terminase large subunit